MDTILAISLIVIAWFGGWVMGRNSVAAVSESPPPDPDALEVARRVLMDDGKIAAIKVYREKTGAGLRVAKLAVETLES